MRTKEMQMKRVRSAVSVREKWRRKEKRREMATMMSK